MARQKLPAFHPRAVIFTHFGSLRYVEKIEDVQNEIVAKYTQIIKHYLECNHIAIVYAYVDWAVRRVAPRIERTSGGRIVIEADDLYQERTLIGLLRRSETRARQELRVNTEHPPNFHYVGINDLLGLLRNIVEVDPKLVTFLHGRGSKFGYDSPKFVEAVIRLARGHTPHLAIHPVIRIDEDVQPNTEAIRCLIGEYLKICREKPFFFFSGTYGTLGGKKYDPRDDHAVRVPWFFDVQTQTAKSELIRTFLSDLNELGATQLHDSSAHYSSALKELLKEGRPKGGPERTSLQVISGAGLIMSSKAVNLLPPFMNFKELTTWIDDHLKRRLHEVLGDIGVRDVECVEKAKIKQDRYPKGITQGHVEAARKEYFDRLLRGCIFRRLITNLDGTPTRYSNLIGEIVRFRVGDNDPRISGSKLKSLKAEMSRQAEERYDEVLTCWASVEFDGYESFKWARSKLTDKKKSHKKKICAAVVDDAVSYIKLVHKWPIFTRAIERLPFDGNEWLYEPID